MVIMTAKVSKRKIIAILLLIALIVAVLAVLLSHSGDAAPAPDTSAQTPAPEKIKTNEARIAYLSSFGWEVSEEPVQTQEVRIPTDPSKVFQRYNELQMSQGFDLSEYAGKTVRRYVYAITNYPEGKENFYATLLVYKDDVIGGDVASAEKGGVMHGLSMPK